MGAGTAPKSVDVPDFEIRVAAQADCAALVGLFRQLDYASKEDDVRGTLARYAASASRAFVAEQNGRVVGAVVVNLLEPLHARAPWGRVSALVVDEAARGRGLGAALLSRAIEHCASLGCSRVEVTSGIEREGAHRFYLANGFVEKPKRFVRPL